VQVEVDRKHDEVGLRSIGRYGGRLKGSTESVESPSTPDVFEGPASGLLEEVMVDISTMMRIRPDLTYQPKFQIATGSDPRVLRGRQLSVNFHVASHPTGPNENGVIGEKFGMSMLTVAIDSYLFTLPLLV
jgi:hypothetical protein